MKPTLRLSISLIVALLCLFALFGLFNGLHRTVFAAAWLPPFERPVSPGQESLRSSSPQAATVAFQVETPPEGSPYASPGLANQPPRADALAIESERLTGSPSTPLALKAPSQVQVCSSCVFTSVQAGVDAVAPGGTVKVASGTYTDLDGDGYVLWLDKSITLRGGYTPSNWNFSDPAANPTILDGAGSAQVMYLGASAAPVVEGFHLRGGHTSADGAGVYIAGGAATLRRNRIYENLATRNGGGVYVAAGAPRFENNLIYANQALQKRGGGFFIAGGSPVIVQSSLYHNQASSEGGGIYINSGSPAITGTLMIANLSGSGGGGLHNHAGAPTSDYNDLWGNLPADYLGISAGAHDISADPLFANAPAADFHLQAGSPAIDQLPADLSLGQDYDGLARPFNSFGDLGAHEAYTGSCFARAGNRGVYPSVQQAIAQVSAGEVVRVAGYCTGSGSAPVVNLDIALILQGGYTLTNWSQPDPAVHPTILDGEGARQVLHVGSVAATIEGFAIRNGFVLGSGGGAYLSGGAVIFQNNLVYSNTASGSGGRGGGVFLGASTTAQLLSNQIFGNLAEGDQASAAGGGGLYIAGGAPLVQANQIYANQASNATGAGGGIYTLGGGSITGNDIYGNSAGRRGGGLLIGGGDALVASNEIHDNFTLGGSNDDGGGGLYINSGGPVIRANRIYDNAIAGSGQYGGGGIHIELTGGGALVERNAIYDNDGGYRGGGIYVREGLHTIRNNLIYNNTASTWGAGLCIFWGNSLVENNTIYANSGDGINNNSNGTPIIRNNIVASNSGYGIERESGSLTVYYNDVWNNTAGNYRNVSSSTDINLDPLFVAPVDDFSLQAASPAIDAADPVQYPADDYTARQRPFGARADIGAYEHFAGTCFAQVSGQSQIYGSVQDAVDAAPSGGLVKVAGLCQGVTARSSGGYTLTQTVFLDKSLTLRGGYTLENLGTPSSQTVLDAQSLGRVIYLAAESGSITVDGFIMRGGSGSAGGGATSDGGGLYQSGPATVRLQNLVITGNSAQNGGGFASNGASPRLLNNTFSDNLALAAGGAVHLLGGSPVVSNTLIVSNTAASGGGIYAAGGSNAVLAYNNAWHNAGGDYGGSASAGPGSLSVPPGFVSYASGDLHLRPDSLCIHAGDPSTDLASDFEGDPRPLGRRADIGADESIFFYEFSFGPDLVRGSLPGEHVVHTHFLTNTGTVSTTIELTHSLDIYIGGQPAPEGSPDWVIHYQPEYTLAAGDAVPVPVTLSVPSQAISSTYAQVNLTATARLNLTSSASAFNRTVVNWQPGAQLSPAYHTDVNPGTVVTYVHTLANAGNAPDLFDLAWSSSRGWSSLAPTPTLPIELGPYLTTTLLVTVAVPGSSPGGLSDTITLTVNSQNGAQALITDTTTANYTTGDRYVISSGDDTLNSCQDAGRPCRTIAYAVEQATNGNTIHVAAGTYYEAGIIVNKDITLRGGYTPSDWLDPDPTLHPTIIDAQQAGRIFSIYGSPIIEGFLLRNGQTVGSGGAVFLGFGAATLNGNILVSNTAGLNGGGIYVAGGAPFLWNNILRNNLAAGSGGGAYIFGSQAHFYNNTLYNNSAQRGGGLFLDGGAPAISNTIVVANSAASLGGGIYGKNGSFSAAFSDVWNNQNGDYYGVSVGTGSLSVDPLFVDPASGDLHLQAGSPLIDAGAPVAVVTDFDWEPRRMGQAPDIGADEFLQSWVHLEPDRSALAFPLDKMVFTHTLTNTGPYRDTFVFSYASSAGWAVTLPQPVTLDPGLASTISVSLQIPLGVISGTINTTILTATSQINDAIFDTASEKITIGLTHAVSLEPDAHLLRDSAPTHSVIAAFTNWITNTGSYTDSFTFLTENDTGYAVSVLPPVITLGSGLSSTVSVRVTIPPMPPSTVLASTSWITAVSQSDPSATDSVTDTTYVNVHAGFELAPDRQQGGLPLESVAFTHWLTNTGNYTDSFTFAGVSSHQWQLDLPQPVELRAGEAITVVMLVKIPSLVISGTQDLATLTATSFLSASLSSAVVDTTIVGHDPGLALDNEVPQAEGYCILANQGNSLYYGFKLSNLGNYTDTFSLAGRSEHNWAVSLFPANPSLPPAPDSSTGILAYLQIPPTTQKMLDTLWVTATSQSEPFPSDSASYTTRINWDIGVNFAPDRSATLTLSDALVYTHTVTNTGEEPNQVVFYGKTEAGWHMNFEPGNVHLEPGESALFTLTVTVPPDVISFTGQTVITATTTEYCLSEDWVVDTTLVRRPHATITPEYNANVLPGSIITYQHYLTNTGGVPDSWNLSALSAIGWSTTVTPAVVGPLDPGQVVPFSVVISVPAGLLSGTAEATTIQAESHLAGYVVDTALDLSTVPLLPSAVLAPDHTGNADPGEVVSYTHSLTNNSNYTETFYLAPHTGEFAYAEVQPTQVTLGPGQSYSGIQLLVHVVPHAPRGAIEHTQLIASFAGTQAVAHDTTIVNQVSGTRYVAPDGTDSDNNCLDLNYVPCASLQYAIEQASAGDEVRVAQGSYTELSSTGTLTQVVHLDRDLTLLGGFSTADWETAQPGAQPTVLDAGGAGRVVYVDAGLNATISGFVIQNGSVAGDGAGIYLAAGSQPIITYNLIMNNLATGFDSQGGGLHYAGGGQAVFSNNTFQDNQAEDGAALYQAAGSAEIWNNVVAGNSAADLGGGFYLAGSSASTLNNTFYNNHAENGGALYLASGTVSLSQTLLISNTGYAVYNAGADLRLAYNGVWLNQPAAYFGVSAGPGSFSADPGFRQPASADFRLRGGSPAIDAGDPAAHLPPYDRDGSARPQHAGYDVGAYEYGLLSAKTAPPSFPAGQTFTYTLVLTNTATTPLPGVVVTDSLHQFVDYAGALGYNGGSGQYDPASRTISWAGTLAPAASGQASEIITFTAQITGWLMAGTPVTNLAWIDHVPLPAVVTLVSARPGPRYVTPTGSDLLNNCQVPAHPCASLQHAIDQAFPGDEIRLAGGNYATSPAQAQLALITKTLTLKGGFSPIDWSFDPLSHPTLLLGEAGKPVLIVDGGLPQPQVDLVGLSISGGSYGLSAQTASLVISRTSASDCSVAGLYLVDGALLLERSAFSGNGDGLWLVNSAYTLVNNLVFLNRGAGLRTTASHGDLWHNTFADNGNAAVVVDTEAAFTNTIFADHPVGLQVTGGSSAVLTNTLWYSNTANLSAGALISVTNLYTDPHFMAPEAQDFHLRIDSGAIDQGYPGPVAEDYDGEPRPMLVAPDIGADEFLLGVEKHGPGTADPDQVIAYSLTIERPGANLRITDTLPLELEFAGSLSCDAGVCNYSPAKRAITWQGSLSQGQTATVVYTARVAAWLAAGEKILNDALVQVDGLYLMQTTPVETIINAVPGTRYVAQVPAGDDTANNCLVSARPCRSLQWAVDQALTNDAVHLAQGVYTDSLSAGTVANLAKSISLIGGYEAGGWSHDPQAYSTILDGQDQGRCLVVSGVYSVTLADLHLLHGYAESSGGAVSASQANLTLKNVEIAHSRVSGVASLGGGIFAELGELTLANSLIHHNLSTSGDGGGLYARLNPLHLNASQLYANLAGGQGGGLVVEAAQVDLINVVVAANQAGGAGDGALFFSFSAYPLATLKHTTIAGNGEIGLAVGRFSVQLSNTILAYQDVGFQTLVAEASVAADHTLWQAVGGAFSGPGTVTLTNDLSGDPRFVNASSYDYHLSGDSEALNTGAWIDVADDLDGDLRPAGQPPDVGADQYPLRPARTAEPLTAAPGQHVTHHLLLTSLRPNPFGPVALVDQLPPEVTYVPGTLAYSSGSGYFGAGGIHWSGTINAPVYITYTVALQPYLTSGTTIIQSAEFEDPVSHFSGPAVTVTVVALEAHLAQAAPAHLSVGEVVTYSLVFSVPANHSAFAPTLVDSLPRLMVNGEPGSEPALVFLPGSASPAPAQVSPDGGTITWTLPTLVAPSDAPALQTVTFNAQVLNLPDTDADDVLTNTASLDYRETDASGPPHHLAASLTSLLVEPVLEVNKELIPASGLGRLDPVLTSIQVSNSGAGPLYNLQVTDTLPEELGFLSASPGYLLAGNVVSWQLTSLSPGASAAFTITAQVLNTTPPNIALINTVTMTGASQPVPNLQARFHTASAQAVAWMGPPDQANLALQKLAEPAVALPGGWLTYTLRVENSGLGDANGLVITDALPAHTSYLSCHGGLTCALLGSEVAWQLADLPSGAAAEVSLTVLVDPGLPNGAEIVNATYGAACSAGPEVCQPVSGAPLSVPVGLIGNLELLPERFAAGLPGQTLSFQHTLTNGVNAAQTISLTAVSSHSWQVSVAPETLFLESGAADSVLVQVTIPLGAPAGQVDLATVTATGALAGSASLQDTLTVVSALEFSFSPDRTLSTQPGLPAVFTHTLTNLGNSAASFDLSVSAVPAGWIYELQPTVVADLPPGGSAVVQLSVTPAVGTTGQSTAIVTATRRGSPALSLAVVDKTLVGCVPAAGAGFSFNPLRPQPGQSVHFSGSTDPVSTPPVTYSWDFGDGSAEGSGPVVNHAYAVAGVYQVILTVSNACGLDTASQPVTVAPQAVFLPYLVR